jgi:hypothetical protein
MMSLQNEFKAKMGQTASVRLGKSSPVSIRVHMTSLFMYVIVMYMY